MSHNDLQSLLRLQHHLTHPEVWSCWVGHCQKNAGRLSYYLDLNLNLKILELLQMAINMHHNSPLGANKVDSPKQTTESTHGSEALDSKSDKVKLDKSNILMLGPTGSGLYLSIFLIFHIHFSKLYCISSQTLLEMFSNLEHDSLEPVHDNVTVLLNFFSNIILLWRLLFEHLRMVLE